MPFIGQQPPAVALTASDITDGIISTAKIADDAVTKPKLDDAIDAINYKNILINGDMQIAQRATSTASVTGNGYHTIDRMFLGCSSAGTWTQSQDTDVPTGQGFGKSLKMDNTTADASLGAGDNCILQQRVEGQMLQHLKKGTSSAESLMLSFWVKAVKTGTNIVELYDNANTRQISKSYTVDSTNTWEKKEITFAGDTTGAYGNDNAASLFVNLWLSAGTDYTSGTLSTTWTSSTNTNRVVGQVDAQDSTSNNIYVTGIQLEVGDTATDFEFLPWDVNLKRCLRYFQKTYDYATAPATSTDQQKLEISTTSESGNNAIFSLALKVPLRTTPTATFYKNDGTAATWTYGRSGASGDASMTAYAGRYGENHLICYGGVGASWIACNLAGHYTVSSEL